jgi:ABC-type multidrug transport system ATPase subunit
MTTVIEATGLTKWYGKRRGVLDVGFVVEEGEVFGFLGPNGAGKTTTIRLLLGLMRPSAGSATVLGHDAWMDAAAAHERLSYVSSDPGYLGELTAREQLDYMARLRGLPRGAWRPAAERLELDPTIPIRKLSRGNRQKVAVVQAFMGDEPLLVMDEPTSGLDPLMQREFLKLVAEAHAAGRTVFLSSHNLPEVERACDRVGIIREGRLVSISTVSELQASHWRSVNLVLAAPPPPGLFDLPDVRVVSAEARDVHLMVRGDVNPFLRRLASIDVRDVSIATLEIEDVFLGYYEGTNGRAPTGPDGRPAGSARADTAASATEAIPTAREEARR